MNIKKYYNQLVEDTLSDHWLPHGRGRIFIGTMPVFTLQLGDQKVDLTLSMDEEGNGGGFGFIEVVK